jgi:membrane-bound lytic murein transglycosylase D
MNNTNVTRQALSKLSLLAALLCSAGCATVSQDVPTQQTDAATEGDARIAVATEESTVSNDKTGLLGTAGTSQLPANTVLGEKPVQNVLDVTGGNADLWQRIRAGYALPTLDSPYIARHEQWFANNPVYMENMINRAQLYLYYIVEEVEKRGMPMEIALLPAIESAYQPHAYSRARAVGLWQFIPSTGRLYGLKANWWYDGRRDVIASTQAALDYLEKLNKDFKGDWQLALAAYNCGEGKVARLMAQNRRKGLSTAYQDLPLPRETKNYVPKLMAMVNIITNPEKYGLKISAIPNEPYFTQIDIGSQIDLGVIAKLVDLPVTDLSQINPEYVRWITDPNGPHQLLVPADKKDALLAGLSNLPEDARVQWLHHEVRRGDTISQVARRYGVTIEAIKTSNRLNTTLMRVGQDLLIPVSNSKLADSKLASAAPIPSAPRKRIDAGQNGQVRVTYRVRSGDTLWSIARRYKVYVHELRQWNLLHAGQILQLGQKIQVWTRHSPRAEIDSNPSG